MCLIIAGPAGKIRSLLLSRPDLRNDIFAYNSDGFGAMYANRRGLKTIRVVPRFEADVERVLQTLPDDDRNLALHWRMKTHGEVTTANCHPYDVSPGRVAMMHNGVLHTGNAADPSRSDTYHFIQDFLADGVEAAPGIVHREGFKALLSEFIGDNRFVFMDHEGEMSIVNKDQGIEHDGIWFANEYAWSPEMVVPNYRSKWTKYYMSSGWRQESGSVDLTEAEERWGSRGSWNSEWNDRLAERFLEAAVYADAGEAGEILDDYPRSAMEALYAEYTPVLTRHLQNNKEKFDALSTTHARILRLVLAGDIQAVVRECRTQPAVVADVICYHTDWLLKLESPPAKAAPAGPTEEEATQREGNMITEYTMRYRGKRIRIDFTQADLYSYIVEEEDGTYLAGDTGHHTLADARGHAMQVLDIAAEDELDDDFDSDDGYDEDVFRSDLRAAVAAAEDAPL